MTAIRITSLFSLAMLAMATQPVLAGGYGGSIKDYGAVPVPAPMPVPVYRPAWYFRGDIGIGFGDEPDVTAEFGGIAAPADTIATDFGTVATVGVGVGFIWNRWFRTDLTADYHPEGEAHVRSSITFPAPTGLVAGQDTTSVHGGVVLFNGYIDLGEYRGFTPYVGAGIGFYVSEAERSHSSDAGSGSAKSHDVSLAAAFMAGLSYELYPAAALDFSYRYLYLEGTDVELTVGSFPTRVSIGDIGEHQLRAGVRLLVD